MVNVNVNDNVKRFKRKIKLKNNLNSFPWKSIKFLNNIFFEIKFIIILTATT